MKGFGMMVGVLPQQQQRYHVARNPSGDAVINSFTRPQEYWQENEQVSFSVFRKR
jgi:saccharopine dehydrogenase-like NADP-dependent oxidoreductase